MLDDDHVVRRTANAHQAGGIMSAIEAANLLEISRPVVIRLAKSGQIAGKLLNKASTGKRRWIFKREDVIALKEKGNALLRAPRPRRIRVAWVRHFGPIPKGMTVFPRDGRSHNVVPENLALAPLQSTISKRRKRPSRFQRRPRIHHWTAQQRRILRRDFATKATADLAKEFGVSALAVRCQARKLRLRKSLAYLSERARKGRSVPIGTERLDTEGKNVGTVMVKVCNTGLQSNRWRPKHHIVWQKANGRRVPKGFRIVFTDGDRTNFDPSNLELTTREAIGVQAFAKFMLYPPPLQDAIHLTNKLQREIASAESGHKRPNLPRPQRTGVKLVRWTPEMDAVLYAEFATRQMDELAAEMGVSRLSLKCRAKRLGLRRSPEAMIERARAMARLAVNRAMRRRNAHHQ